MALNDELYTIGVEARVETPIQQIILLQKFKWVSLITPLSKIPRRLYNLDVYQEINY